LVLRLAEARLDAERNPKAIDLTVGAASGPKKTILGIYKLEGVKLTLCFAVGDRRPTEFRPAPGRVLFHYEKTK
jgi:uncharacterized protein (TIGR03067 family)